MISLDEIFNKYESVLKSKGISCVDEPYRTIIAIYSVQGILDNGGFEYLFENKFNDRMPIEVFYKSYENIGLDKMAKLLAKTYRKKDNLQEFKLLDDEMFKLSNEVWQKLDDFIENVSKGD